MKKNLVKLAGISFGRYKEILILERILFGGWQKTYIIAGTKFGG